MVTDRTRTGLNEAVTQVELQFALSPRPLLLIVNQTIPSTYSTKDAKEKQQDCRELIQPHISVASAFSLPNSLWLCGAEETPAGG